MESQALMMPCEHCQGRGEVLDDVLVGREMKRLRKSAGISLMKMAASLRLTKTAIINWEPAVEETGNVMPSLEKAYVASASAGAAPQDDDLADDDIPF